MNDMTDALDASQRTLLAAPDTTVSAREVFGVDVDWQVPAFSKADARVPDIDESYVFDPDTTLAILAGFAHDRRVMVQGYHGTGKSTHIEQVAARLNWPLVRIISTRTSAESISSAAMPSFFATVSRSPSSAKAFCRGRFNTPSPWCSTNMTPVVRT